MFIKMQKSIEIWLPHYFHNWNHTNVYKVNDRLLLVYKDLVDGQKSVYVIIEWPLGKGAVQKLRNAVGEGGVKKALLFQSLVKYVMMKWQPKRYDR